MVEDDSGVVPDLPVLVPIDGEVLVELVDGLPVPGVAGGQEEVDFVVDVVLRQVQVLHDAGRAVLHVLGADVVGQALLLEGGDVAEELGRVVFENQVLPDVLPHQHIAGLFV